jgi:predicted AAA+ superfamily ATPase
MIYRSLQTQIEQKLGDGKAIILYGSRQVGKTTLIQAISKNSNREVVFYNGDEPDDRQELTNVSSTQLRNLIGENKLFIIDEAQRITNIGITLKLIVDQLKDIQVIATGSSAFELANEINEPLTGRKWEFQVFPLSMQEMASHTSQREEKRLLNHRLIYGYYPEIVTHPAEEEELLKVLANSLLYKDILSLDNINKPVALEKLVQALAFQIGSEVSISELAKLANIDFHTVERYLDLLKKAFIIFELTSLSRNLRNEIKKNKKIYFFDNGIRNAIIRQFKSIELRNDVGALWENYLLSERMKRNQHQKLDCNRYFWRTHAQQEIDYIEEYNGNISAFEFKFNPKKQSKMPTSFQKAYQPILFKTINSENYLDFVL